MALSSTTLGKTVSKSYTVVYVYVRRTVLVFLQIGAGGQYQ